MTPSELVRRFLSCLADEEKAKEPGGQRVNSCCLQSVPAVRVVDDDSSGTDSGLWRLANDEPVLLALHNWAQQETIRPAACFQANFTFLLAFRRANKTAGSDQAGLETDPIHSHCSDDWYMRTSLVQKGCLRSLDAGLIQVPKDFTRALRCREAVVLRPTHGLAKRALVVSIQFWDGIQKALDPPPASASALILVLSWRAASIGIR